MSCAGGTVHLLATVRLGTAGLGEKEDWPGGGGWPWGTGVTAREGAGE